MLLKEIMTPNLETVDADASVREAARKMASVDIGFVAVADTSGLVGVITDRDIALRLVAEGKDSSETKVRDIMSQDVVCCGQDTEVQEAARLMEEKQIRRLVVTDGDGGYVGVASLGDLAVKTDDDKLSGETLQKISEPAEPARQRKSLRCVSARLAR